VKEKLKALYCRLFRKDPEAVVVSFCSGDHTLAQSMVTEVRGLITDRRHYVVAMGFRPQVRPDTTLIELDPGSWLTVYWRLRRKLRRKRVGLAPVLFAGPPHALRKGALLLAPRKILAYNARLERHHLRLRTWLASLLFLRGVPVDRIFLRPRWLRLNKVGQALSPADARAGESACPTYRVIDGRAPAADRPRIAVLSPYVPYPLSHGGAVRIFHLLRETAREFDVILFTFSDGETDEDYAVLREFCMRIVVVGKARYREPRWSTLYPPEVHEFDSPAMRRALADTRRELGFNLLQVEYTHLAGYGGEIIVEHDVTFDLFGQVLRRRRTLSALWNFLRWRRYELTMVPQFRRAVVMAEKDSKLLGARRGIRVIENGVDTERFRPEPETPGQRLLFIGSFRHFPNIEAYRFFTREVWPALHERFPRIALKVVCGPDHLLFWREFTRTQEPQTLPGVELLGFVRDVRPLYVEANLVIVPTTVSAGTNVKVLEAMAMSRAVVSTSSGCAGLGLQHGTSAWIADDGPAFAAAIAQLIEYPEKRARLAAAARELAVRRFDWKALGEKQRQLYRELLARRVP
jgi:glycosyltransferase involved in cell wall biosynthesis